MARAHEFSAKVKDQAWARCKGFCEARGCGLPLYVGKFEYDHLLPVALGGPSNLANCRVLCEPCHTAKTSKEDVPRIRKADRQRRNHIGASVSTGPAIKSKGFPRSERAPKRLDPAKIANGQPAWARRFGGFAE